MKKLLYSFTALTLLANSALVADAQKAATKAAPVIKTTTVKKSAPEKNFSNVKIGFIDPYGVLEKSKEWQAKSDMLRAGVEERAKKIAKLEADLQKKTAELKNMGNAAKQSAKEEKGKELLSLENSIMIEKRALQEIPQQQAQAAQYEILKKIETVSKKIAESNKIDTVLAGSTIYVNNRIDITDLVADELNKSFTPAAQKVTA